MRRIEEYYFTIAQAVYDWLWDRFGIYLGTVLLIANAPDVCAMALRHYWVGAAIWSACVFIWAAPLIKQQQRGAYKERNLHADQLRKHLGPYMVILWFNWITIPLSILPDDWQYALFLFFSIPIQFAWSLCYIRERREMRKQAPVNAIAQGAI